MEEHIFTKDFTKEEKAINTFEGRKELYEKTLAEKSELSIDDQKDKLTENELETKKEILTDKKEINDIFKLIKRDKIIFKISNNDKDFHTKVVLLKNEGIHLINSFSLYGEIPFPDNVICSFELEGNEYVFELKFKEKLNDELVICLYPNTIKIFKRRSQHRIKAIQDITVGLYWPVKNKEFLGSVVDVSSIGIGLKFDYEIFDMELFTLLNSNSSKKSQELVMMLEINKVSSALNIKIKHVKINEKKNTIEIGAEFMYTHDLKNEIVDNFILDLTDKYLKYKKNNSSIMLIESSKKGIILND